MRRALRGPAEGSRLSTKALESLDAAVRARDPQLTYRATTSRKSLPAGIRPSAVARLTGSFSRQFARACGRVRELGGTSRARGVV